MKFSFDVTRIILIIHDMYKMTKKLIINDSLYIPTFTFEKEKEKVGNLLGKQLTRQLSKPTMKLTGKFKLKVGR